MNEIKIPAFGLTEKIRQTLVDYHVKILEEGIKVGYSETISHEQARKGIYTKDISKCIPLFLYNEYQPFQNIDDLSCSCSESIYYKLYAPLLFFWRETTNHSNISLDDQLIIYNKAYAITLHALNTIERPNEYLDMYMDFLPKDDYNLMFTILGVVYVLLSHEERTLYIDIFLDDLRKILQDDFPEILKIDLTPSARDENRKDRKGEFYYNIAKEDKRDKILQAFHDIIESKQNENQKSGAKTTTLGVFVPRLMWVAYKERIFNKKPRVKWVEAEFGEIVKQQAYDKEWRDLEEGTDPPELTEIRENLRKVFEKMSI